MAYYNSDAATRVTRLFRIVTMVASRRADERIGLRELAEGCDCSEKTIRRDLECLGQAQVPIEYDRAARTYALPAKGWTYPVLRLTPMDAMALAVARGLVAGMGSAGPLACEVARALEKATAGLSPALREWMEAAALAVAEPGGPARDYSEAPVGALMEAITRRVTVEMLYESASGGTCERRPVDPYRLDRRDGRYFELQAWCPRNGEVRTFALDRILEVRLTGETFTPRSWDARDEGVVGGLRGGAPVEVVVRFDAVVARFARARRWSFAATFEACGDDGAVVMRGVVQGTEGIVRELLSWRRHARVLGGAALRARMADEVRAMAGLYAIREEGRGKREE